MPHCLKDSPKPRYPASKLHVSVMEPHCLDGLHMSPLRPRWRNAVRAVDGEDSSPDLKQLAIELVRVVI